MCVIKANVVVLDAGCHLIHNKDNAFASLGRYSASSLAKVLEMLADDVFVVEYRTVADPAEREKDRRKFSKRLETLGPLYVRGPWRNRVIDGNVFENVFECVVNRIKIPEGV